MGSQGGARAEPGRQNCVRLGFFFSFAHACMVKVCCVSQANKELVMIQYFKVLNPIRFDFGSHGSDLLFDESAAAQFDLLSLGRYATKSFINS